MGRPPGVKNKPKETTAMNPDQVADDNRAMIEQRDPPASKGDVAIFQPARLPFHPAIEERFGVDKGQWKVLVEAIFPAAKSIDAVVMALTYCKSRNLDPFKRPVHIVPMWDSARGAMVETVWPGISELRTTASRTKGYAGCDEAEFGPAKTETFKGRIKVKGNWEDSSATVTYPAWCRITVYRVVDGQRCKFVGPKVVWEESFATIGNSGIPNTMWQERPEGQLEKCAEAAALRRAFPEEIGNDLTAEEMIGRNVHDLAVDIPHIAGETTATPNTDGAPPRQIPPASPEDARDGTPPARQPKDPISSGPPRRVAQEPGPSEPPVKPHRVPGEGHTYESWAERYCDLFKTSPDMATAYKWIDENTREFSQKEGMPMQAGPLNRLQKGKPSVYASVKKTMEQTMEKLRDAQEKARSKDAKKAPASDMDGDGHGDMMGEADGEANDHGPADTNPETILKWAKERFATVQDADLLEEFYTTQIEPHIESLFPPDKEEILAEYKRTEKRLGGD